MTFTIRHFLPDQPINNPTATLPKTSSISAVVVASPHERYVQHFNVLYEPISFSELLLTTNLLILTFYIRLYTQYDY